MPKQCCYKFTNIRDAKRSTISYSIVGTQTNNTIVKFGSNWIYTANATGSAIGSALTVNTTYILTYYATAGNPFGTNYPSYTMNIYILQIQYH